MISDAAVLVSKPSQYITARNLIQQLELAGKCDLLVYGNFCQSEKFFQGVRKYDHSFWRRLDFFYSRALALLRNLIRYKGCSTLFTDSDIFKDSVLNGLSSFRGEVHLYEEGLYTYLNDLSAHLLRQNEGTKAILYKLLRLPFRHGDGWRTRRIYVYNPHKMIRRERKASVIDIHQSFFQYIEDNIDILSLVFNLNLHEIKSEQKKISIYCSSHSDSGMKKYVKTNKVDYIKPHPQLIVNKDDYPDSNLISSMVPIEIVVAKLLSAGKVVKLIHEGSSIALNLQDKVRDNVVELYVNKFYVDAYSSALSGLK